MSFGTEDFGDTQFGSADWAEQVLWDRMPSVYKQEDRHVNLVLRKFTDSVKPDMNELITDDLKITEARSATLVQSNLLEFLANDFGVTLNRANPEGLQRAQIRNAVKKIIRKGTDRGYAIVAGYNGFDIKIENYDSLDCQSTDVSDYVITDDKYMASMDQVSADEISADKVYDDEYIDDPTGNGFLTLSNASEAETEQVCRTHYLRAVLTRAGTLASNRPFPELVEELKAQTKAIHAEFLEIVFRIKFTADWSATTTRFDTNIDNENEATFGYHYDSTDSDEEQTDQPFAAWLESP